MLNYMAVCIHTKFKFAEIFDCTRHNDDDDDRIRCTLCARQFIQSDNADNK